MLSAARKEGALQEAQGEAQLQCHARPRFASRLRLAGRRRRVPLAARWAVFPSLVSARLFRRFALL
jgi:hypothetical protein